MFNVYTIYLNCNENGDITFSPSYSSFNKAKNNMIAFLEDNISKRGKKLIEVNKEELEKLKTSIKKSDTNIYVRKKKSEATLYQLNIN